MKSHLYPTMEAAAVYLVLYDRAVKRASAGLEPLPSLAEGRGFFDGETFEM